MIKSNGGVFGRNPTFQDVTVNGNLTVNGDLALGDDITINDTLLVNGLATFNGGLVSTGTAAAPTSNTVIGSGAGAVLPASATNNVAIGLNALAVLTAGATSITNTTPGTGGTGAPTTYTGILLEKDSGTGTMGVYPTVSLRVSVAGAVDLVTITSPGSGATVASGIVLKAVTTPAGVPTDWRGTLASVSGSEMTAIGSGALDANTTGASNTAVGRNALGANTTGSNNTAIGNGAGSTMTVATANTAVGVASLQLATDGSSNSAVGQNSLQFLTTGSSNAALGVSALRSMTTSNNNIAVGQNAGANITTGSANAALGQNSLVNATTGSNNTAVGTGAGRYRGSSTDSLVVSNDSVFVGHQSRAAGESQTNQVVIAGTNGLGNGSNTTTIGNTSTTGTFIAGTVTSVLSVAGDTVRIVNDKTPANAGAAGTEGDVCWDANYIYVCVAANTWKRVAIATWP